MGRNSFNKKWLSITGVVAIVFMLIGGGYSAGLYQGDIKCTLDKNELVIGYQEKLSEAQSTLKDCQNKAIEEKSRNFSEVVNYLKSRK